MGSSCLCIYEYQFEWVRHIFVMLRVSILDVNSHLSQKVLIKSLHFHRLP